MPDGKTRKKWIVLELMTTWDGTHRPRLPAFNGNGSLLCCLMLAVPLMAFYLSESVSFAAPQRPVVVIPGILGSKLCRKGTEQIVWGGVSSLSNFKLLALPLSPSDYSEQFEPCGIIDSIRVIGPFKIHQYDKLLDILSSLGYVEGTTLFVFAYDWRLSNLVNAQRLSVFVQRELGKVPFDIVGHSMGGQIARIYLSKHDSARQITRLVTMGTPHRGTVEAFRVADSGWSWWENMLAGGVTQIRETLMTFPSVYQLLPSYAGCCILGSPDESETKRRAFSSFSFEFWESLSFLPDQFRTTKGKSFLKQSLQEAEQVHHLLQAPIPGHVKFAPLVTGLLSTKWRAYIDPKTKTFVHWDLSRGDGTVWEKSAANMELFEARPSEVEHQRIFSSDAARQVLRWALLSGVDPTAGRLNQDYRATIDTGPGGIDLTSVSLTVNPEILKIGSMGEFMVRMIGKKTLGEADFPVSIFLHGSDGKVPLHTITTFKPGDDYTTERTVRATFIAPAQKGTYYFSTAIRGLEPLEELFEVIQ